jgi:hypothetical protein
MKCFKRMLLNAATLSALLGPGICDAQSNVPQSSYLFHNYMSPLLDAPVFDASGNRLSGPNFVAVLYGGPAPDALQLAKTIFQAAMAPVPFTYTPNGLAGYFNGQDALVNSTTCGGFAWVQVRAWDARLGATYDDVAKLGVGGYGESNLFQARGGAPFSCLINPTPGMGLFGLQSFSLLAEVPEPSSLLLLLLGLPLLLVPRRRRH